MPHVKFILGLVASVLTLAAYCFEKFETKEHVMELKAIRDLQFEKIDKRFDRVDDKLERLLHR